MGGPGFAVVEFDTTGLMAADTDRATRITILLLDVHGQIERQWSSPLGLAGHTTSAPTAPARTDPEFAQVAPTVVSLLTGRVLVAHGATFHLGFLGHELERVGIALPATSVSLCTLQLAHEIAPRVSRSASVCSAELGARPGDAAAPPTSGVGDATATAALLATLIALDDESLFWTDHVQRARTVLWPVPTAAPQPQSAGRTSVALTATPPTPEAGRSGAPSGFLARLVPHLPVALGPTEHHDYLALVDLCLLRGWFTERDSRSLVRLAERLNISRFVCETLHLEYFAALCELAQHDAGALTDTRIARLWAVGDLLDLPMSAIIEALGQLHEAKSRQLLAG